MATQATPCKIKKSYTLSPDTVTFIKATREKRKIASDSEALDGLLHEIMALLKQQQLEAEYQAYYDTAATEALDEQNDWAALAGYDILALDSPEGVTL